MKRKGTQTISKIKVKSKKQSIMAGVITDTGRLVMQDVLTKFEIIPTSKQIQGTGWEPKIVEPPHNLNLLMSWLDISVTHNSCVHVKKQDSVGIGYDIVVNDEDLDESERIGEKESDANYIELRDFFKKVNPSEDLTSVLKKVFLDYEGCGNGYIEVSRGAEQNKDTETFKINGLFHANATIVRWAKDRERLVQKVGEKYVWFKKFGETRMLNKMDGTWAEELPPELQANEIIHIAQYTWKSTLYGLPEWLPALYAMFGDQKEKEYNIDFFLNFGIPAYAVVISGANLKAGDKEAITKYFETELKGSNHKTLTLATPKGTEVKFERLSVESKEASFRMYHKDNRDDILTSHHVPPYRIGIAEGGSLGGNVAESTDRIYLDSVINPRQEQFSWILNELIIKQGFGIEEWQIIFKDINIEDMKQTSEIHDRYFKIGAMSQNEIRNDLGLDPFDGGDILYLPANLVPVGVTQEGIDAGRAEPMESLSDEERQAGEEEIAEEEEQDQQNADEQKAKA